MAIVFHDFGHIILMLIFLGVSFFFSAAETAYLSLTRRQITMFAKSPTRIARLITAFQKKPAKLLATLLLGAMTASTLYFAFAGVLTASVDRRLGTTVATVTAATAFFGFVLFGEMLPKTIAYANPPFIAQVLAFPCFIALQVLSPIRAILTGIVVDPVLRLILGPRPAIEPISLNQFRTLIESSRRRGLISADENQLLAEILEFGSLKVRQAMRPRVDIIAVDVKSPSLQARQIMIRHNMTKIPVYTGAVDNLLGSVSMRNLLMHPEEPLSKFIEPAHFVPEQKTVESVLEYFRANQVGIAVVVDEYGGIAGTISLSDIVEEIVGPLEPLAGVEPIQQVGPLKYRLAGSLAVHDWASAFGIDPSENRLSTVGGMVIALLGKIPRPGDVARLGNLTFTVELVRKNRIETLILALEPLATPSKEKP